MQIGRGLNNLVATGVIPKDLDLAPAFEKNPPLTNYLIKIKEKPTKITKKLQNSNILIDETLNLHLDNRTFLTEKPVGVEKSAQISNININQFSLQKPQKNFEIAWHKLQLAVKQGQFYENSVEFQFFKKYNQQNWGLITQLLKKIENFLEENEIKFVHIRADKLLSLIPNIKRLEKSQIVQCIMNQDIIKSSMYLPSKRFKGIKAEELAITFIKQTWKGLKRRRAQKRERLCLKMAKTIQQYWRVYKMYQKTKEILKTNEREFFEEYTEILKKFKKQWEDIKGIERVEVHINSFSYTETQRLTMENFLERANLQISRIFACKDPLIAVVYVTPIQINEEIINYYSKVIYI